MAHFATMPQEGVDPVPVMILNLVDPSTDAGAVSHLISQSLQTMTTGVAVAFDADPLIDYRAQRPLMNYKDGRIVAMRREGIAISHALDVEGQPFLLLHGTEPDFRWNALTEDIVEVARAFGVERTYSFTAVPAPTPHTRPAGMVVRSPDNRGPVLEADFWFPSSFADHVEFHVDDADIRHTNIAVRVPMYLSGHRFSAGALAALGMASSMSGLHFPIGDLEQEADEEADTLAAMAAENEELATMIASLEHDFDTSEGVRGFVNAPDSELRVPSMEEIGRATEQFLAGATATGQTADEHSLNSPGVSLRIERASNDSTSTRDSASGGDQGNSGRRGKHSL